MNLSLTRACKYTALLMLMGGLGLSLSAEAGKQDHVKRHKVRADKDANIVIANTFELVDLDKNGKITSVEFVEHVKIFSFKRLDRDGDKAVSLEEWNATETGPEGQELFARWDQNLDGKITLKEFKQTPRANEVLVRMFRTLDVNEDGTLVPSEFEINEVSK